MIVIRLISTLSQRKKISTQQSLKIASAVLVPANDHSALAAHLLHLLIHHFSEVASIHGNAIAQSIRQSNEKIPIIFVTAKTQTEDVIKGFETGGNDYIRKPFSMEELIVRINNLLRITKNTTPANGIIKIGEFEFAPERYELKHRDNTRKLSHREAMLLLALSENKNNTITRKEVLMKVWGDDSFFNSRNLDVYISKLRDFFKPDPSIEIITIKGVGYRFVAN